MQCSRVIGLALSLSVQGLGGFRSETIGLSVVRVGFVFANDRV